MSRSRNPRELIESKIQEIIVPIIQEHFENYLQNQLGSRSGVPYSGRLTIEDVSVGEMLGPFRDFGQLEVKVKTSMGTHKVPLIVKVFEPSRIVDMAPLANATESMKQIYSQDSIVNTPNLLYFSHGHLAMFFEALPPSLGSFFSSSLDHAQRYSLAGRALASIQGYTLYQVDYSRYLRREFAAISHLPSFALENENDKEIADLFKSNERNLKVSYGGARSCGNFLPNSLYIPRSSDQKSTPEIFLIDPSLLNIDEHSLDRFEDIAYFFSRSALTNLAVEGSLDRAGMEDFIFQLGITDFIEGYDSIFEPRTTVRLLDLYGEKPTLGYQLALRLLELIPLGLKDGSLTEEQTLNVIEGVKTLLQESFLI
ncbi:MAG: hypothetical protein ACFFB3_12690 [Candidatus Hodarchaeota archaeon]